MLGIGSKIYNDNLLLTKAYCELQIKNNNKSLAEVLRSFNPQYDMQSLFSFKQVNNYFTTEWSLDPIMGSNKQLYNELFEKQLEFKSTIIGSSSPGVEPEGQLMIAEIDYTFIDGASEEASQGFIDINDCPPIDTWFYLASNKHTRLLFCWIPQQFVDLVDDGINANPVDCFYWYTDKKLERISGVITDKILQKQQERNGIRKSETFWHRLKKNFSQKNTNQI